MKRPPTQAFQRQARQHIDALLAARTALLDGDMSARHSLRRLARQLRPQAVLSGQDEVAAAAGAMDVDDGEDAIRRVDVLLAELRRATGVGLSGRPALVVDDDPVTRSIVKMIVQGYVHGVHEAGSLTAARELLRTTDIGLVVLDVQLEDGDGRDFLAELRGDPSLDRVPVLVFTARDDIQVRTECLALGATEVHTKPPDALALDIAFAALTGHEDRTTLAIMGDPATGFADRQMLVEAIDGAGRSYTITRKLWCVLAFGPGTPGVEWMDAERETVVEAMRAEFTGATELLARAAHRLVALLHETDAAEAEARAARVLAALPDMAVSVGGSEGAATDFATLWPTIRRMSALSQGSGQAVVVEAPRTSLQRPTVLLVDDDPVIAAVVRSALREDGLQLAHVTEGRFLADVLDSVRPRLVLLDVLLPGPSGYDLLEQMQAHPRHRRIPVVLLTSMSEPRQEAHGLELGAVDHVSKPFDPVVLRARVRRVLRAQKPSG